MKKTTLSNDRFSVPIDLCGIRGYANSADLKKIALSKVREPFGDAIADALKQTGPFRIRFRLRGPIEIKVSRDELEKLMTDIEIVSARSGWGK